jgi:hypothetical protein
LFFWRRVALMPQLTLEEQAMGRAFRNEQQQALTARHDTDAVTYRPPGFLKVYRHPCPARNNRSIALQLREIYTFNDTQRFGWIYKEGKCSACRRTALSPAGKLVDAIDRPPAQGAIVHDFVVDATDASWSQPWSGAEVSHDR